MATLTYLMGTPSLSSLRLQTQTVTRGVYRALSDCNSPTEESKRIANEPSDIGYHLLELHEQNRFVPSDLLSLI